MRQIVLLHAHQMEDHMQSYLQRRQRDVCLTQPSASVRDAFGCIRAVSAPKLHEQHALSDVLHLRKHTDRGAGAHRKILTSGVLPGPAATRDTHIQYLLRNVWVFGRVHAQRPQPLAWKSTPMIGPST